MSKTFFISDLHFNHKRVIEYDKRPFNDIEDMEEQLIKRWNAAVKPGDCVYILGDLNWSRKPADIVNLLKKLNGDKKLIKGNHDQCTHSTQVKNAFGCYIKELDMIDVDGRNVVLCHYPIASWKQMQRRNPDENAILLYGHVHMTNEYYLFEQYLKMLRNMKGINFEAYNVGAACPWIDYTPRTIEEIRERYNSMKDSIVWDELPSKKPVKD